MRALRYDRYGPPEVLHVVDVAEPKAAVGEVKIRVRAVPGSSAFIGVPLESPVATVILD